VVEHGHLQFVRVALLDPRTSRSARSPKAATTMDFRRASIFDGPERSRRPRTFGAGAARRQTLHLQRRRRGHGRHPREGTTPGSGPAFGCHFSIAARGAPAGALHLYATEPGFFDDELVNLIDKLAQNVSFALNNFQREAARRGAEKALRESEQRFRDIAQAAGEYVWENDNEGRFTYLSPKWSKYWATPPRN